MEKNRAPRYESTINLRTLFTAARTELAEKDSPAYLAFLIAMGAGLRKAEIDGLEWNHINSDKAEISVQAT